MGKRNGLWHEFLMDEERYADMINAFGAEGRQVVLGSDIKEADSKMRDKNRDEVRKVVFGINFAIIGIESQETIDYSLAARTMYYDAVSYDADCRRIRNENKSVRNELKDGEYLYLFKKTDRVHPVISFVVYCGKEPWNAAVNIRDMIDTTDIPEELLKYVSGYSINVIDVRRDIDKIRRLKTDAREVLEFIACSDDENKLNELAANGGRYETVKEDAYNLMEEYAHMEGMKISRNKKGEINMCKGLEDMKTTARNEGIKIGESQGKIIAYYDTGMAIDEIAKRAEQTVDFVKDTLRNNGLIK